MKKGRKEEESYKWHFAMGTTSRVPHSKLHYLMGDIDDSYLPLSRILSMNPKSIYIQKTENGWHFYTDIQCKFSTLVNNLLILGCDAAWIRIGIKRGYFFLADKAPIVFPYPVERMVLRGPKIKKA